MNTVTKRRLGATLAAIALTAGGLGVAGCGGDSTASSSATATTGTTAAADNGVASLGAQEILTKATAAANAASSVRIAGNVDQGGEQVSLDLTLGKDVADGTLGIKGQQVDVRLVDGKFYLRAPAAFYEAIGGGGAAIGQLVGDKWFSVPLDNSSTAAQFAAFQTFTNKNELFDSLLKDASKATVKGTGDVSGQPVVLLDDSKGGILAVATTGEPYPIQVRGSSSDNSGTLNFTSWNAPVNVKAPADAIDLGSLTNAGDGSSSTTTSTGN
jgi:hypothetical protein